MADIAIRCIEFEIEVHKLQKKVNAAIDQGAFESFQTANFEEEVKAHRELVRGLQEECDNYTRTLIRPLEEEVRQITSELQEGIHLREEMLVEQDRLKEEIERFEIDVLEMESAAEDMNTYHTDAQIMFHNLRMNLEQTRIEIDNDQNVVLRKIFRQQNTLQSELDALERTDKKLVQKCADAEKLTGEVKMMAQQLASENDALHEELTDVIKKKKLWCREQPLLSRMASETRLSIAGNGGSRRRSLEIWSPLSDNRLQRSAEIKHRSRSMEPLPRTFSLKNWGSA
uniref:Uncharacterized protein n=1 Tax=Ditylum brightwellii TaxID=49249 RepID=A0A7S4TAE6_9STRA